MFNCLLWSRYKANSTALALWNSHWFNHFTTAGPFGGLSELVFSQTFWSLTPSKMLATANRVDGETSASFDLMDAMRFSGVSLRPSATSQNRSVFAVHSTMTLSHPDLLLNIRIPMTHIPILIQVSENEGSGTNGQYLAVFGLIIWYCIPYLKSPMSARTCSTCSHLSFVSMTLSALSSWGSIQLNFDRLFKRSFNRAFTDLIGYCDTI